jgi:hypothetical protein
MYRFLLDKTVDGEISFDTAFHVTSLSPDSFSSAFSEALKIDGIEKRRHQVAKRAPCVSILVLTSGFLNQTAVDESVMDMNHSWSSK